MKIYQRIIRPLLFLFNPEAAHHLVFNTLKLLFKIPGFSTLIRFFFAKKSENLERTVFGIRFPNPVGMAAGFDKDAKLFEELSCMGFGFIEVGTVTPNAQPGNPKPRMFRLPDDNALINRMGFNNEGVQSMVNRLKGRNPQIIVGGNIGKNKDTPNQNAVHDYEICFRELFDCVDYFVVNVSSPNTAGLRDLQEKEPLLIILKRLQEVNKELSPNARQNSQNRLKPILLKISPDLSNLALDEIIDVCLECHLDGIVATNTTIERRDLNSNEETILRAGEGGLSGKPLTPVNRGDSVSLRKSKGPFEIIGAGGIHSPADANEKLLAGASLIQVYTGFIYEGPWLVKKINTELEKV